MKFYLIVILVIVGLYTVNDSFFVLQEDEQALTTEFGKPRHTYRSPGIRFKKPFVVDVHRLPKKILGSDTPAAEYLTLDKKKLVADPISRWRITDPLKFYKTVGDVLSAKARLDDIVNSELREEIASRNFGDIIGNKREDLVQQVSKQGRPPLEKLGIGLIDVRIKRTDLPTGVQESVFQRMRAERDRVAKKYEAEGKEQAQIITSTTDKDKAIILAKAYEESQKLRGEGDAQSVAIYAEAYEKDAEFYDFTRSLQTYEKIVDPNTKMVLSTDNDLLKYVSESK